MAACVPVEVSPVGLCLGTRTAVHTPPYTLGVGGACFYGMSFWTDNEHNPTQHHKINKYIFVHFKLLEDDMCCGKQKSIKKRKGLLSGTRRPHRGNISSLLKR